MAVNLRGLIAKLNAPTRSAVEAAAGLCLSRTNYDVEIEHFLVKVLDANDGDLAAILKHFGINRSRLADDLARALDRIKTGNARTPSLSPSLVNMLSEGWLLGSVEFGAPRVRTGHALLALLSVGELARMAQDISKEFEKIPADVLKKDFATITAPSAEASAELGAIDSAASSASASSGSGAPKAGGRTPNLDQYTVDLTANAKAGKIDAVLGRDLEVRQVVDILTRRRQNNPILVGEAGVGKTAVVEGFARRIAEGDVPPPLRNVSLRSLDLAMLQAGAGVKGEFENRLKGLIAEVKNSPTPIILFIDEAHTMIGAGGAAGQNDAANLLKPALALSAVTPTSESPSLRSARPPARPGTGASTPGLFQCTFCTRPRWWRRWCAACRAPVPASFNFIVSSCYVPACASETASVARGRRKNKRYLPYLTINSYN